MSADTRLRYACDTAAAGPAGLDEALALLAEAGLHDALDGDPVATWPMNEITFGDAWRSVLGHTPQFSLERRRLDYLLSRGLEVQAAGVDELQCDGGPHASDHALVWARYGLAGADSGASGGASR